MLMYKKFTALLFPLITLLALISLLQNTKAEDICALEGLGDEDTAKRVCGDTCAKVDGMWNGVWLGTTDKKCSAGLKVQSPNIYGSVCACSIICRCVNGEQIACDESKN